MCSHGETMRRQLDSFACRMSMELSGLDVDMVTPEFSTSHDDVVFVIELLDKRRLKVTLDGNLLRHDVELLRSCFLHEAVPRLRAALRRCVEHDDCRQLKSLGEACWRDKYQQLAFPVVLA